MTLSPSEIPDLLRVTLKWVSGETSWFVAGDEEASGWLDEFAVDIARSDEHRAQLLDDSAKVAERDLRIPDMVTTCTGVRGIS